MSDNMSYLLTQQQQNYAVQGSDPDSSSPTELLKTSVTSVRLLVTYNIQI